MLKYIIAIAFASGRKISDVTLEKALMAYAIRDKDLFIEVEESPGYPGGYEFMLKFIHDNMKYPALAKEGGIQGTVFVQFIISITGKISNAKILRGIGSGCDEEAIRIVKIMPKWNAGRQSNVPVFVMWQVPIKFQL